MVCKRKEERSRIAFLRSRLFAQRSLSFAHSILAKAMRSLAISQFDVIAPEFASSVGRFGLREPSSVGNIGRCCGLAPHGRETLWILIALAKVAHPDRKRVLQDWTRF